MGVSSRIFILKAWGWESKIARMVLGTSHGAR